ncbi:MAG: hypothetical protein ACJA1L_003714, partial [Paracoccaceae bacterium]
SHVPPAATLFLHRKIAGMYLMATRLRARVALRPMLERYRCPPPPLTAPPPGPKGWR